MIVSSQNSPPRSLPRRSAFSLVELLVVVGIVALLSSLLLPALSNAKQRASAIQCLGNGRQLMLAWLLYADDARGALPYNVGGAGTGRGVGARNSRNWADGILDWELTPDNTNSALLKLGGIGPYLGGSAATYQCPADRVLSLRQKRAGWLRRSRSYAMNAMMGNAGEASTTGGNVNNPGYRQFFRLDQVPAPVRMFVFVDEHPDSINDGYFLNRGDRIEWIDLPASFHGRAATLSFADGHAEVHRWTLPGTVQPAAPDAAGLPLALDPAELADWRWLLERMSVVDGPVASPAYDRPY